jgi:dihydroflavonol-4-reductase
MGKTLVTGATGLIGYNIVRSLLSRNRKVVALVRSLDKGKKVLPAEVKLVQGDILDKVSVRKAVKDCEVIYHTAGWPEQWLKDISVFEKVNVTGTKHLIEAAQEAGAEKFIYTSTIDVFKGTKGEVFNESEIDPEPKHTPYERSKQKAFQLVLDAIEDGLPAVNLHPAGLYGPGPAASPGINNFFVDLRAGKVPMLLPGGLPLVFSEDVGEGHVLAEEQGEIGSGYILSDNYFTIKALAQMFLEKIGSEKKAPAVMPMPVVKVVSALGEWVSKFTNKPPLIPKGQMEFLQWGAIPDSSKAINELGWKCTGIEEGMEKTIEYLFREE